MLIAADDNVDRVPSESARAKLRGLCPVPANSGKTSRHRLNRNGHRPANSAFPHTVIGRLRLHHPTIDDVARRTAEDNTKVEMIRYRRRYVTREA